MRTVPNALKIKVQVCNLMETTTAINHVGSINCTNKPLYKYFKYIYRSSVEKCYFFHQFNPQQSTTTDLTATHNNLVISHLRFMKCRTLSIITHPEIPQRHTPNNLMLNTLHIRAHQARLDCTAIRFLHKFVRSPLT